MKNILECPFKNVCLMYYTNLIASLDVRIIVVLCIGVLIYSLIISLRFNPLAHFHVLFNVLFCH